MQRFLIKIFKVKKTFILFLYAFICKVYCRFLFYINGVKVGSFHCKGIPYIHKSLHATINIGDHFNMNNGARFSDSGLNGKCRIEVRDTATLIIGNNVGMSDVTITCHEKITIGNNVLLGVGAQIRDTDNHSLNPQDRIKGLDWKNKRTAPIIIGNNVFIGAYSFILKGVSIGENSIIGAGSIVTKNIPSNQIWAGNSAKFIREIK